MAFPTTYELLNLVFLTPYHEKTNRQFPALGRQNVTFFSKTGQTLAFPTTYDLLNLVFLTPYLKKDK